MTARIDHEHTGTAGTQRTQRTYWLLGNKLTVLANHPDTEGRYDFIEGNAPVGLQTPPHRHTRYSEQFYVIEGEVTIWSGTEKIVLHPGEEYTIPVGTVHVGANTGQVPVHSLVIASPSGFARVIEEAGTPDAGVVPSPPSPEGLDRFERVALEAGDENLGPIGELPTG